MRKILERLVHYGYEWHSIRGELLDPTASYLSEDETLLLNIIQDAEKALKGEK